MHEVIDTLSFLNFLVWLGTVGFAISGIILSIRKDLDLMGTYIVAILSCSGGGVIRDVLLNKEPALLFSQNTFLVVLVLTFAFKVLRKGKFIENLEGTFIFRMSDTLGLASFATLGAYKAVIHHLEFFPVLTMTLLSSVGGGLIRDALLNRVNATLTSGFYGSVSIIIGILVYISHHLEVPSQYYLPSLFIIGIVIRTIAIKYNLNLVKMA